MATYLDIEAVKDIISRHQGPDLVDRLTALAATYPGESTLTLSRLIVAHYQGEDIREVLTLFWGW